MIATVDAPAWPVRVITIRSESRVLRWPVSEYRHHGIAVRSHLGAIDSILESAKEPGSVILVPSDITDLPLLEFVELAISLGNASVVIGRVVGVDAGVIESCLGLGACGVVDLPVNPERLAEAISAVTPVGLPEPEVLSCGPFTLDRGQHRVYFRSQELILPLREFELLEQLMRIHPRVATTDDLALRLGRRGAVGATHIPMLIRRLRVRLGPAAPSPSPVIETVRGVGYRLAV